MNAIEPKTIERFWAKVKKSQGCWEWQAALNNRGYGQFIVKKLANRFAHRFAYLLLVGPIPTGLVLDHLCRNPKCVKPSHLEPVTNKENSLRGFGVGAINARKTTCLKGHILRHYASTGKRQCPICQLARVKSILKKTRYGRKNLGSKPLPVVRLDNGSVYPSMAAAAKSAGVTASAIWYAVNIKCRADGSKWHYAE